MIELNLVVKTTLECFNRTVREQCVSLYIDYLDEPVDFSRKLMD